MVKFVSNLDIFHTYFDYLIWLISGQVKVVSIEQICQNGARKPPTCVYIGLSKVA